jgi:hypothetical protein
VVPRDTKPQKKRTRAKQALLDAAEDAIQRIEFPKRRAFLQAYAIHGTVNAAAKLADVSPGSHYAWLGQDPEYREAFEFAQVLACDSLETEAVRRAMIGSDTLMIFLLKALNPAKYREQMRVNLAAGTVEAEGSGALRIDQVEVQFRRLQIEKGESE